MTSPIAVDLGAYRTKVAVWSSQDGSVELLKCGSDSNPFLPSIFYVGADGRRLFGDEAADLLGSDATGFLRKSIKRELRARRLYAANGESASPIELLTLACATIRKKVAGLPTFATSPVDAATFTVPREFGVEEKDIILSAAKEAGFSAERIGFVEDPVSAAQAWQWGLQGVNDTLIVLDCGGGSLRWTSVSRSQAGHFEIIPELTGGDRPDLGLNSVDETLLVKVCAGNGQHIQLIRRQFPNIRDAFCRNPDRSEFAYEAKTLRLARETLAEALEEIFVRPVCECLQPFVEQVRHRTTTIRPPILVVGGGGVYSVLRSALESTCRAEVVWAEFSEYAGVLGALVPNEARVPIEIARAKTEWCDQIRASIDRALTEAIP